MTERLLQYLWQFQFFNASQLQTGQGESLKVIHPGTLNTNQGPDFLSARIRLENTTWVGNVEIHINTSDWYKHDHEKDPNYKNIILHVVWKNDEPKHDSILFLPLLELQPRVSILLLQRYEELMNTVSFIPCEKSLQKIHALAWAGWKERLVIERLQRKSGYILELFKQSNRHWEETFWWMIARNFGARVNADAFETIAQTIPVNILARHRNQIHQLEALLFGQAGLLEKRRFEDDYALLLQREYRFYQKKYKLKKNMVALKFLRMRPSSFPTIRLAQLAMLIKQSTHLFSGIKEIQSLTEVRKLLNVTANDYWHYHYRFEEKTAFKRKNLGDEMVNIILVNAIIPVLFAFGFHQDEESYKDKALRWLEEINGENNKITRGWSGIGITNSNAYDSQSLIELKTMYCDRKRCLECSVGNTLLSQSSNS
ncbi:MAG: DUF2851 family protein [Chitinophagaceae bacterium]